MALRPIILVHGSFHTAECWYLLTPILQQRGFAVHSPTLPGQRGNPRHPLLVSFKTYADAIIALAESIGEPVVLLGHSLAGFPISVAAERRPELFSHLIYVAAAIPAFGRATVMGSTPNEPRPAIPMKAGLTTSFPAELAGEFFYNCCPAHVQAHAASLLSPQPLRPLLGAIKTSRARLGTVPKHFVECLHDKVTSIDGQRAKQGNLNFLSIETLDADHSPFLSAPVALADAIDRMLA